MKKTLAIIVIGFWLPVLVLSAGQIDINTASLTQLDQLAGVGPVIAQRIIDERPYASLDDLLRVSGIGPKKLQKIKDQGMAFAISPPLPKPEKSGTTKIEPLAATSETITKEPSPQPTTANPWPLFWGTFGAIGLAGGIGLYIKFKIVK